MPEYTVHTPTPHAEQDRFIKSTAKRKVIRAGRRGGKTVGISIYAVDKFLDGKRILYATPTAEQVGRFWSTVTRALDEPIRAGVFKKNETDHTIELPGTEQRIKAKTAWNADTLRGDYADELIFDEWQLMNEDAWELVGAPMMLDKDGNATFIYTPPSLHSRSVSKANDPQHAAKMYKKFKALQDAGDPRYAVFSFSSHSNPHLSKIALDEITKDMTALAYRMEIEAQDVDEAPGALWHRRRTMIGTQEVLGIEDNRVFKAPQLMTVAVGVDPSGSSTGAECGIVACGIGYDFHHYTLEDNSIQGSPDMWAREVCRTYHKLRANIIVAESNYGGEMVEKIIRDTDPTVTVKLVTATRGKAIRAEPISAKTERGEDHLVGNFPSLEDELCLWSPGDKSPNRLDAKVWADTYLMSRANTPKQEITSHDLL